jgi:putative ABC transport system permease protein
MENYIRRQKVTKFLNILKVSIKNINGNKLRTILTMLGLIIGIASVIILVGIGSGTSNQVTSQVQSLGADVLTLNITSSDTSLEYDNIDELKNIQDITAAAPYKTVSGTVTHGENSSGRANIIATTNEYMEVMNLTISSGRLLSTIDLDNNSKVCLLGSDIAETLFENDTVAGNSIKIDGDNYTVIGVITATGSSMGNDIDSMVIIPFTTAKYLDSDTTINNVYIKVEDENKIENVSSRVESYIISTLGLTTDDFSVSSQDSMLSTMDEVNNSLSIMLGGIASISLIVAGIGVMNVMLVSVTERTKEIGIRKALGAKRSDILIQFLIEALLLCIVGGIIGIGLGVGIGMLLNQMGYNFVPEIWIILIAFFSSVMIGLLFGIFPAYKASKLNPIDALHTE